jgi:hypothetical protein
MTFLKGLADPDAPQVRLNELPRKKEDLETLDKAADPVDRDRVPCSDIRVILALSDDDPPVPYDVKALYIQTKDESRSYFRFVRNDTHDFSDLEVKRTPGKFDALTAAETSEG